MTEPRFTMLPMMSWMRPRRSAFIVTPTFVVVDTVRDCCVISRAAGLGVRRPGDPATPDSCTPCSSRPFGTSCGVTVVCHPPASRSGRRSGLFDRDRKINQFTSPCPRFRYPNWAAVQDAGKFTRSLTLGAAGARRSRRGLRPHTAVLDPAGTPRATCRVQPVCIASGSVKPVKVGGLCPENRGPTGTAEGEALDGQRDVTHHRVNDAGHVAFISDPPVDPGRLRSGPNRPASRPVARRALADTGSSAPAVAARTTSSTATHGAPVLMQAICLEDSVVERMDARPLVTALNGSPGTISRREGHHGSSRRSVVPGNRHDVRSWRGVRQSDSMESLLWEAGSRRTEGPAPWSVGGQ